MRTRKTPSRLELHRLKYHRDGYRGPLLSVHELDDYDRDLIQNELLKEVKSQRVSFTDPADQKMFDKISLQVLTMWGIACMHPHASLTFLPDIGVYQCGVCECELVGKWPKAPAALRR
jgi:hypothetical protein